MRRHKNQNLIICSKNLITDKYHTSRSNGRHVPPLGERSPRPGRIQRRSTAGWNPRCGWPECSGTTPRSAPNETPRTCRPLR